ncbi:hypothetical protein [Rhizobium sp. A37_96]
MWQDKDQLPRIFQANLARLFDRVILPGLDALPTHSHTEHGEAATLSEFLDRAAAQVDNYTANEAAKAYALTLSAVFERQLSIWARTGCSTSTVDAAKVPGFQSLLAACARQAAINDADLTADLTQMFLVANVVRHGEGPSCDRLRDFAPALWDNPGSDYKDLLAGPALASEHLRIRKNDLVRYIRATTRFWGLADPLPMAVAEPPYWPD